MEGPIWVAGAMSGTSLDGVDAALLKTDGRRIFAFGETRYRPYRNAEREVIRAALGCWPGDMRVAGAAEAVEGAHAAVLSRLDGAGMVGFHGQTLAHDPKGRGTHQAGDGQVLADVLGLPVVWDFRSSDVQLGGEGAPLAPYYHFACAKWIGATRPLVVLNLGGVGNLTWVDPRLDAPEAEGAVMAFDTGPGNAPLDDLMQARRGVAHDECGALSLSGVSDRGVVAEAMRRPFLSRMPPKSLDRGDFADLAARVAGMGDADAAATLAAVTVACVAEAITLCPGPPARVLVTGGGRHNAGLMQGLTQALPCPVAPVEDVGLDGDMLEAQAFAFLAARVARGMSTSGPMTTGVAAQVGGGRISRPRGEVIAGRARGRRPVL